MGTVPGKVELAMQVDIQPISTSLTSKAVSEKRGINMRFYPVIRS